jgi:pimeloyl-ACP methyl ester carboxylesterase
VSLPGSFVETSAGRVFVHRSGRGAPLVLVHGWMMSHWCFRQVIEPLAAEREIIAVDLPGYGESDRPSPATWSYDFGSYADVVDEVLRRIDLDRVDLLGASMGGGVALALAARHPERVQRLVLVDAVVYPPPVQRIDVKLALLPGIGPILFKRGLVRAQFARTARGWSVRDGRLLDEDWVDYFWSRLCRAGGREAAHACLRMLAALPENTAEPGRVRAPTLLVWGDEDRLVPLASGRRLSRAIAGARLEIVPVSGHMPFHERPDEFLRIVRPFLAEPAPPLAETPVPPRRAHRFAG